MHGKRSYAVILLVPILLVGCGQGDVQALKQTVEKQQAELKETQALIASLKAENADLKRQKGNSAMPSVGTSEGRRVTIKTITGKVIENGRLDYFTTSGSFPTNPTRKDVFPLVVDGASVELKADKVRKIEVTGLIPNPPKVYGWEAAAVTVTTTDNEMIAARCDPALYFHVILPESFTMASLSGLFKSSLDERPLSPGELARPLSRGEFKEIDGKNILAIPVAQIASITFD